VSPTPLRSQADTVPSPSKVHLRRTVLALSALLLACGSAGYTVDSATSACRQNPIYCARVAGEETVVPTAVTGGAEVASVAATLHVLAPKTQTDIESALRKCADWADERVNLRHFGGKSPSRAQCQEEVEKDPCDPKKKVTRAMQVGKEKHRLALQCTSEKLGALIPGRFSLEQRYRGHPETGRKELVSPEEARTLLKQGCGNELEGTIVPDVVIHSGNPLEVLAIYDFKFPCPETNRPDWRVYERGPFAGSTQGKIYFEILKVEPNLVAPIRRIIRWLESLY
jgi:hypothetical protein